MFLWGTILVGSAILLAAKFGVDVGAMRLFKLTAAMNGGVMFVYSAALLYMNKWRLPANVRMSNSRIHEFANARIRECANSRMLEFANAPCANAELGGCSPHTSSEVL